ncbi:MAG: RNA-binding protein [Dorea sp.]|nr:RNA-binding protein [Dorea sp.]
MNDNYTGMLARSAAGHDKGKIYVIIAADSAYVYLVDGKSRTLEKPKKKKQKHIQIIKDRYDIRGTDDAGIRRIVRDWKKEEVKQED